MSASTFTACPSWSKDSAVEMRSSCERRPARASTSRTADISWIESVGPESSAAHPRNSSAFRPRVSAVMPRFAFNSAFLLSNSASLPAIASIDLTISPAVTTKLFRAESNPSLVLSWATISYETPPNERDPDAIILLLSRSFFASRYTMPSNTPAHSRGDPTSL